MAEVLITLGIVGVVAVVTMPNLINNLQRKELQVQLKKTYNELTQINQKFMLDFGMNMCEYEWAYAASIGSSFSGNGLPLQFSKYLVKGNECINRGNYYAMKVLTGENLTDMQLFDDGCYTDALGRTYYFEYANQFIPKCPMITVDVNGLKKPNRMGYDIFIFRPTKDGRVIGMGKDYKEHDNIVFFGSVDYLNKEKKYCNYDVIDTIRGGFGCTYYALADKHPFDETKSYWKDFLK